MPDKGVLTLDEIRTLVRDACCLVTIKTSRIRGRKQSSAKRSSKEHKASQVGGIKMRELEVYRTGMGEESMLFHLSVQTLSFPIEVPDLT